MEGHNTLEEAKKRMPSLLPGERQFIVTDGTKFYTVLMKGRGANPRYIADINLKKVVACRWNTPNASYKEREGSTEW